MSNPTSAIDSVEQPSTSQPNKTTQKRKANGQIDLPEKNNSNTSRATKPTTKNGKLTLTLKTSKKMVSPTTDIPSDDSKQTQQNEQSVQNKPQDEPTEPVEPVKKRRKLLFTVSPPEFRPLDSHFPSSIIWLRLSVRDFVIRFEKIVTIPLKHYQALNNAVGEWDDRLYKAIVLMLFKVIYYDSGQVVPYKIQREYKRAIEKTQNNVAKVFALLDEFLYQAGFSPGLVTPEDEQKQLEHNGFADTTFLRGQWESSRDPSIDPNDGQQSISTNSNNENTTTDNSNPPLSAPITRCPEKSFGNVELDQEYRRLYLLNSFIVLASQTESIRASVTSYPEALKTISKTFTNDMAKIDTSFDRQLQKIRDVRKELSRPGAPPGPRPGTTGHNRNLADAPKTKKAQLQELSEKEALLRETKKNKIRKAKETQFFNTRRFIPKNIPLGMDYFGNTYWHFQQKSKDIKEFGFWIIIEKSRSVPLSFGLSQFLPKTLKSISPEIQNGEAIRAVSTVSTKNQKEDNKNGSSSNGAGNSTYKRRKTNVAVELHSDEIYGNGQGLLFYMKITHNQIKSLIDWLTYQHQVFLNPTSRTRKLLAKDASTNGSFEPLLTYIKSLQYFAEEDEDEEITNEKSSEKEDEKIDENDNKNKSLDDDEKSNGLNGVQSQQENLTTQNQSAESEPLENNPGVNDQPAE